MEGSDPEDIFSSSLESLYDYQPVTLASAGSKYTYTSNLSKKGDSQEVNNRTEPLKIVLTTPDTLAANWFLHASDIWAASLYLANHLDFLDLDSIANGRPEKIRVLELGAAAGLPGILLAKTCAQAIVTVSDYPDVKLIETLSENIFRNGVSDSCRVIAYAWGADAHVLTGGGDGFDLVLAADTLWNPDLHVLFIATLRMTLRKSLSSRVHLVAGLHTGRYTIQSFINTAQKAGLELEDTLEKEVSGKGERLWDVTRWDEEEDRERRRWVVWMVLKWGEHQLTGG
ncbi:putative methyltransferase-domain-containing protein [Collybia nuda]|uniref:Methyltransferase-domain-containing protein n=1 Tax=Collybia nuda TaxID=64659 RepID=A0A9P5YCU5_9AGAR|nr:putative methyltransferase-domain-containing protein [Collybia nuda]